SAEFSTTECCPSTKRSTTTRMKGVCDANPDSCLPGQPSSGKRAKRIPPVGCLRSTSQAGTSATEKVPHAPNRKQRRTSNSDHVGVNHPRGGSSIRRSRETLPFDIHRGGPFLGGVGRCGN